MEEKTNLTEIFFSTVWKMMNRTRLQKVVGMIFGTRLRHEELKAAPHPYIHSIIPLTPPSWSFHLLHCLKYLPVMHQPQILHSLRILLRYLKAVVKILQCAPQHPVICPAFVTVCYCSCPFIWQYLPPDFQCHEERSWMFHYLAQCFTHSKWISSD